MIDTTTELLDWSKVEIKEAEIKKVSELAPFHFKFPQEIIHIKHYISWQQYKYWAFLLQELWQQIAAGVKPDEKGFYAMPMKKMAAFIGYVPKKSEVWNDLKAIKNETLAFNVLNKDKEKEKYGAGFISEWQVSNSYIRFKFPSMLEEIMRKMEEPESKAMFSWLCMEILDHFSGKYAAIIYKLCKDYAGAGRTPSMALKHFREYMGIKEFEYPEFKKLNARVIAEPVKRINDSEVSDIRVFPEFDRPDRRVIWLYFRIEYKKQTVLPLPNTEDDKTFHAAKIPISQKIQEKYRAIRPANEIELCIERANDYGQQQEVQGKSVSYGRLYAAAIKEGWHEEKLNAKNREAAKHAKRKADQEAEEERKRADAAKIQSAKDAKASAWEKFSALPDSEQWAVQTTYLSQAKEPELVVFRKLGTDSPAFRIFLVTALRDSE